MKSGRLRRGLGRHRRRAVDARRCCSIAGCHARGLPLERIASLLAAAPARRFRIARQGLDSPSGYDADLALVDLGGVVHARRGGPAAAPHDEPVPRRARSAAACGGRSAAARRSSRDGRRITGARRDGRPDSYAAGRRLDMERLGHTRSAHRRDHLLQTPDTFVRAPLPGMRNATAIVHISPAGGARFTQYTAEFEAGGPLAAGRRPAIRLRARRRRSRVDGDALGAGRLRLPAAGRSRRGARPRRPPRAAVHREAVRAAIGGTAALRCFIGRESRSLPDASRRTTRGSRCARSIPDDPAFDFRVNTMTYQPGASAAGRRDPRDGARPADARRRRHLSARRRAGIRSTAGDFIWMAPYCPQWFGALGKTAGEVPDLQGLGPPSR